MANQVRLFESTYDVSIEYKADRPVVVLYDDDIGEPSVVSVDIENFDLGFNQVAIVDFDFQMLPDQLVETGLFAAKKDVRIHGGKCYSILTIA